MPSDPNDAADDYNTPASPAPRGGADDPTGCPGYPAHLRAWDAAPWTSEYELLIRKGVEMPDPDGLSDREVSAKLWEVIARLADRRVYLYHTDHLSDRELYEVLVFEILHERIKDVPPVPGTYFDIDLLGSGSDEDAEVLLRYYLIGDDRADALARYPHSPPDLVFPPYFRDAYLPQPPTEDEPELPDYLG